jgi:excisionase family DNA binding protein
MSVAAETTQRYLSYADASRYSGMSEQTLRRLVDSGRLKVYRPTGGRKVVFDRHQLDELIQASAETEETGP